MSRSRRQRKSMAQMNVVPYIDVMLVLLVIFMVTAPMMQSGVEIDMPDAEASPLTSDNQQEPLIISVDQMGKYFLPGADAVEVDQLDGLIAAQLTGTAATRPVYVRADASVEYRYLMDVMVAAQRAGAKTIGLMAEPLPASAQ